MNNLKTLDNEILKYRQDRLNKKKLTGSRFIQVMTISLNKLPPRGSARDNKSIKKEELPGTKSEYICLFKIRFNNPKNNF